MIYILILFILCEMVLVLWIYKICSYSCNIQYYILDKNQCNTKLLVVIPAHNEELQIIDAINSIKKANYPQNFIDIVILNDRCTDKTVEIAHSKKVKVYSLSNKEKTKGGLLKSFCNEYIKIIHNYDYVCISDADTIFDENFFIFAHNNFKNGYKIVQSKICNIQYKKSIVSYFMTFFQHTLNLFMLYQNKIKRSVIICGKGVLITPDVIEQIKWDENSLVEDISFSFEALLKGYKIYYCNEMKIKTKHSYKFFDFWIQQRRWTSGQIQIMKKYRSHIFNDKLAGISRTFVLIGYINLIIFATMIISLLNQKVYILIIISLYFFALYINLIIMRHKKDNNIKCILTFPFMLICWHIIFLTSFFKQEKKWKQIKNKY